MLSVTLSFLRVSATVHVDEYVREGLRSAVSLLPAPFFSAVITSTRAARRLRREHLVGPCLSAADALITGYTRREARAKI
jgi:hypothetical protein